MTAIAYVLQPRRGTAAEISEIGVTMRIEKPAEGVLLELRHIAMNVLTPAADLELAAEDAEGTLVLHAADSGDEGALVRQWTPHRPVAGTVVVHGVIPVPTETASLGVAPPLELRAEAGAVSGGAAATLPRPPEGAMLCSIEWDLTQLPDGARGVSSLGSAARMMPAQHLDQIFFAAGTLQHYPEQARDRGFSAAWHGEPPFDVTSMMAWGEQLHGHMREFFNAPDADYRVFLRRNEVNPGGGIGMLDSFLMTFGDGSEGISESDLRLTLSHEMFHTFQPMIAGDGGVSDSLSASWFNEGLAVFYQRVIPYRNGMLTDQEFIDDVNLYAARYGTNIFSRLPNSEVPGRFWSDTRVRTLPYDRGFLFFVSVDEALREAGGASLDDLVREMRSAQRDGGSTTAEAWTRLLERELGDLGTTVVEEHLAGRIRFPSSGAFGHRFRHTTKRLRRFELGFAPAVLTESPRIIRELVEGSAAQEAGLLDGDEILDPIGQDRVQGDQDATITLRIRRGGQEFSVTYLPRGEYVDVTLWERDG